MDPSIMVSVVSSLGVIAAPHRGRCDVHPLLPLLQRKEGNLYSKTRLGFSCLLSHQPHDKFPNLELTCLFWPFMFSSNQGNRGTMPPKRKDLPKAASLSAAITTALPSRVRYGASLGRTSGISCPAPSSSPASSPLTTSGGGPAGIEPPRSKGVASQEEPMPTDVEEVEEEESYPKASSSSSSGVGHKRKAVSTKCMSDTRVMVPASDADTSRFVWIGFLPPNRPPAELVSGGLGEAQWGPGACEGTVGDFRPLLGSSGLEQEEEEGEGEAEWHSPNVYTKAQRC